VFESVSEAAVPVVSGDHTDPKKPPVEGATE
jgi:hypothetical protein